MSFRFYRYENGQKIYQCASYEEKFFDEELGTKYRIPIFYDTDCKKDATVFPIDDWDLANFISDWLGFGFEEVEEE